MAPSAKLFVILEVGAQTGAANSAYWGPATTSGAPASGTWPQGAVVSTLDGHVFVCTTAGTPGTWRDVGGTGGGGVASVSATDTSVVVDNTDPANPTVATGTLDVIVTDHPPAADWSNNGHKITNVADGSAATDVVNKGQLDAAVNGLDWKQACRLATHMALPANSYSNGASGVGATLTGTSFGALAVDGVTVSVGDRVLVKDEVAGAHNGIYVVTTVGGVATLYVLTRASDYNTSAEIVAGTATFITEGSTNSDTAWVMTTTGTVTVGTTALVFAQFGSGAGAVTSVFGRTGAVVAATNDYSEAQISFTDITTNNVSTSKHGYTPKLPNDATKYLDGTGAYSVPPGTGGGITHSYIGYNTIGGTAETLAAGNFKQIFKQVTTSAAGLLASIELYCKGNASNVQVVYVCVLDDNAGVPGKVIAVMAAETSGGTTVLSVAMNATSRWVAAPIGAYLAAGTYWLGVLTGNGVVINYDGSGGDYTAAVGATWAEPELVGGAPSNSSRKYSIRANLIQ